jgi:hypothetical protein
MASRNRIRRSRRGIRERYATRQIRLASLTVLRAQSGMLNTHQQQTWIQDVNDCFARMFRNNPRTTFADALHAYANQLEGYSVNTSSPDNMNTYFTNN